MPKKYNEVWIHGRAVNLDDPKFKSVTSVEDVTKTNHFESLHGAIREDADKKLFEAIQKDQAKPKGDSAEPAEKQGVTVLGTGKTQEELDAES